MVTTADRSEFTVSSWAGLTVRVAWTLVAAGVRVRPQVLRDARDNVLFQLRSPISLAMAEDRAEALTRRFVWHAKGLRPQEEWPQDMEMPLSPRWRRAIELSLTPLTEVVFRQHYGEGRPMAYLEERMKVDRVALECARGGLREVIRDHALADGIPMEQWPSERIDALLCRIAVFCPEPCPPVLEAVSHRHPDHLKRCVRCSRADRLIRSGVLRLEDLLPPTHGASPLQTTKVMLVHLHPEFRCFRDGLLAEFKGRCFGLGDDLLFLDWADPQARDLLCLAAEVDEPGPMRMRGALVEGPGRWTRGGLIGPLVERAQEEVRSRRWGQIDGMESLPEPLPVPHSASRLWQVASGAVLLAVMMGWMVLTPPAVEADYPLETHFTQARGGFWTQFDVDEQAHIMLVRESEGELDLVFQSQSALDKASLAIGDGSYRLHTMGTGVLLVSSKQSLRHVGGLLMASMATPRPLGELAEKLQRTYPGADIKVTP